MFLVLSLKAMVFNYVKGSPFFLEIHCCNLSLLVAYLPNSALENDGMTFILPPPPPHNDDFSSSIRVTGLTTTPQKKLPIKMR